MLNARADSNPLFANNIKSSSSSSSSSSSGWVAAASAASCNTSNSRPVSENTNQELTVDRRIRTSYASQEYSGSVKVKDLCSDISRGTSKVPNQFQSSFTPYPKKLQCTATIETTPPTFIKIEAASSTTYTTSNTDNTSNREVTRESLEIDTPAVQPNTNRFTGTNTITSKLIDSGAYRQYTINNTTGTDTEYRLSPREVTGYDDDYYRSGDTAGTDTTSNNNIIIKKLSSSSSSSLSGGDEYQLLITRSNSSNRNTSPTTGNRKRLASAGSTEDSHLPVSYRHRHRQQSNTTGKSGVDSTAYRSITQRLRLHTGSSSSGSRTKRTHRRRCVGGGTAASSLREGFVSLQCEPEVSLSSGSRSVDSHSSHSGDRRRVSWTASDMEVESVGVDYHTADDGSEEDSFLQCQEGFAKHTPSVVRRFFIVAWYRLFGVRQSHARRQVHLGGASRPFYFVPNVVCNQKYTILSFLPVILFQQFRFFFNLFYLIVAVSQVIPALQTGPIFTFIAPLLFVLFVTISKEAYDDYKRYTRDQEANSQQFEVVTPKGIESIPASSIKVGHILQLQARQRVPCDVVFLMTKDKSGTAFVQTDQLDGETDWKLRRPIGLTHRYGYDPQVLLSLDGAVEAEAPRDEIHSFLGKFCVDVNSAAVPGGRASGVAIECDELKGSSLDRVLGKSLTRKSYPPTNTGVTELARQLTLQHERLSLTPGDPQKGAHVVTEGISLENTMWANSVVTSGPVLAIAVYTGKETRAAMCRTKPSIKTGLFDLEVNFQSKILFWMLVLMALVLVIFKGLHGVWYLHFARFILLLSSIIPISLRVNMDMAKTYYSYLMMHDDKIPNTVVRTSTIPEELGRIDYLLTDKTGTLTRNNMIFKELHIGKAQFSTEDITQMKHMLDDEFVGLGGVEDTDSTTGAPPAQSSKSAHSVLLGDSLGRGRSKAKRLEVKGLLRQAVIALSLCHTVTPAVDEETGEVTLQAASPDEVALVKFAATVGLRLHSRNEVCIVLEDSTGQLLKFDILSCFPFSSETRRMGIIVKDSSGTICFFAKGAEIAMIPKLQPRGSHWVLEECGNFARKGLRTLVVAQKVITTSEYASFRRRYDEAGATMTRRSESIHAVMNKLEMDMELVGLTGVEDMLQHDVPLTLESLRHAGIKIWMLTGDKVETATCIAISAGLKARQHSITYLTSEEVKSPYDLQVALERFGMGLTDSILIVDGSILCMCLALFPNEFIAVACTAPSVVCCRCSPAQKADVVTLIKSLTGYRTCAVGDGGNDVPMIQSADCGIGIVGNEGKQASLAADFSISQFNYIRRLLLWHGRNSFQRSSKLAQFVIHRGMIIAVMQAIFSAIFFFIPVAIFQGWLTVGYATYYTMWPVFSLVLDVESPESVVFMFPELYLTLKSGRDMSIKTFCSWIWKSVYQGSVIMMAALVLFEDRFINIVSIAFTSLILSELLNVISEVNTWHPLMIVAQFITVLIYLLSMCLLKTYFDLQFIITGAFWWRVCVITVLSWLPVHIFKVVQKVLKPPQYSKLVA